MTAPRVIDAGSCVSVQSADLVQCVAWYQGRRLCLCAAWLGSAIMSSRWHVHRVNSRTHSVPSPYIRQHTRYTLWHAQFDNWAQAMPSQIIYTMAEEISISIPGARISCPWSLCQESLQRCILQWHALGFKCIYAECTKFASHKFSGVFRYILDRGVSISKYCLESSLLI